MRNVGCSQFQFTLRDNLQITISDKYFNNKLMESIKSTVLWEIRVVHLFQKSRQITKLQKLDETKSTTECHVLHKNAASNGHLNKNTISSNYFIQDALIY